MAVFNDLSEATEYYFNELGKLEDAPCLTEKERKKLKNLLVKRLFASVDSAVFQDKTQTKMAKTELKEYKTEFVKSHRTGIIAKIKSIFHKKGKESDIVQVTTSSTQEALDMSSLSALPDSQQNVVEAGQFEQEESENSQQKILGSD